MKLFFPILALFRSVKSAFAPPVPVKHEPISDVQDLNTQIGNDRRKQVLNSDQNKRIVCLANSRKKGGRCLAGIELSDNRLGKWIRPVSNRQTQELSKCDYQYQDDNDPKLLDIIEVPIREFQPVHHQQENWLIEPSQHWKKIDVLKQDELHKVAEPDCILWRNGESTANGVNDRVRADFAIRQGNSLKLMHVDSLQVSVFNQRAQGKFKFAQNYYALWITDSYFERTYIRKGNGTYSLGECFLTISLGENYEGYCYKLIVAVIEIK